MSEEASSQSSSQTNGMVYQQTFPAHLQLSSEATSGVDSNPIGALGGFSRMEATDQEQHQEQPAAIPSNVPPIAAIVDDTIININRVNYLNADAMNNNDADGDRGSQISHRGAEETEEARMERLLSQQNLLMALEDEEVEALIQEDEEHGMDEEHLNTMTTMEKENLSSNKRQMTSWLRKWLYALKSYFLFVHIGYICFVALTSSILIYILEINNTDIDYVDALFAACSFVSCTGLVAVDVAKWTPESYAVRMLTMILGGNCFMSATMPLLRWFTLRRLKEETIVDDDDRYVLKRWKLRKRNFIDRLETTAILCATSTYFYWCAVHILCFIILVSIPNDNMRVGEVLEHVIAAFQNCCSLSLENLADNGVFIFVIAFLVAGGNTLFPLFFRIQFHGLLLIMRSYKTVVNRWEHRHDIEGAEDEEHLISNDAEYDGRPSNLGSMLRGRQSNIVPTLSRDATWDEGRAQGISKWELGILTILQHEDPGVFHPFLFSWSQTRYIVYTFILLNGVQMLPFLIQQWDVTLAPFGDAQKFLVAFCQSVYVRFAGVNIVDNMKFSNVHTMWMLFAMYIPVIPIPGDRGKRKWKELGRAGAWRLLSSRIFLLFFSMSVIVWIEEERLRKQMEGTRFDITTRALFELVSGYSTSGMSLPLSGKSYFTESLTNVSRMIIALNMIIGRHRWMDLGIDIGLDQLEESDRVIQKYLREREEEWTEAAYGGDDNELRNDQQPTKSRSILDRIRGTKHANNDIWDNVEQSTTHFRPPLGGGGGNSRAPSVLSRGSNLRQVRRSILEWHNATSTIPAPGRRFPAIATGDQLEAPPSSGDRRTPASTPRLHPSSARSRPNSYGPGTSGSLPVHRSTPRSYGTPRSAVANSSISTSALPNRRGSRHASIAPQSTSNTPRSPAAVVKTLASKVGPAVNALSTKVQGGGGAPKRGGAATRSVAVSSVLDSRSSMNTVRKSRSSNDE